MDKVVAQLHGTHTKSVHLIVDISFTKKDFSVQGITNFLNGRIRQHGIYRNGIDQDRSGKLFLKALHYQIQVLRPNLVSDDCQYFNALVLKSIIGDLQIAHQSIQSFAHPAGQQNRGNAQVLGNDHVDVEFNDSAFPRKTSAFHQNKIATILHCFVLFDNLTNDLIITVLIFSLDDLTSGKGIRIGKRNVEVKILGYGIDIVINDTGLTLIHISE